MKARGLYDVLLQRSKKLVISISSYFSADKECDKKKIRKRHPTEI